MKRKKEFLLNSIKRTKFYIFSVKSWVSLAACMIIAVLVSYILCIVSNSTASVELIFVLAVFLVSLSSVSYFYGILASVIGVFAVNWAFTYPYMELNFSIYGYPLTFFVLLIVSLGTSTMTTIIKSQEELRINTAREQATSSLLKSISHDIKNPLSSIIGDLEMVVSKDAIANDKDVKDIVTDAIANAEWLRDIIENTLSITRMGCSEKEIIKKPELPEEIIADVIQKFKRHYPDVLINTIIPDEVFTVPMDSVLIDQLILNLMENAMQHGEATEITLTCSKNNNYAIFSIKDNGTGIKKEYKKHLFDGSMLQMQNSENKNIGLGLMICKTIVDVHGGSIHAQSDISGSEFIFTMRLDNDKNEGKRINH